MNKRRRYRAKQQRRQFRLQRDSINSHSGLFRYQKRGARTY